MARPQGRRLRHLDLEPDRPARLLPAGSARAGRLRLRLPVRPAAASLFIALAHGLRRASRGAAAADARRHGSRARRRRAAARADDAARAATTITQPMQLARIHQYLSMATPLLWIAPARHGRRARARDQRLRRARRLRRDGRPHPRAARGRARRSGRPSRRSRTRPSGCAATPARRSGSIHLADIEAVTATA